MIDLKEFIDDIVLHAHNEKVTKDSLITFLVDNDWFDSKPHFENGKVELTNEQINLYKEKMHLFISTSPEDSNAAFLFSLLEEKFPTTAGHFKTFVNDSKTSEESCFYVLDFMLHNINKDIFLYTDKELMLLVKKASFELTKEHGVTFTFFLSKLRKITHTHYKKEYIMAKRYTMDIQNEAYSMDDYLELLYLLFNADKIKENDMYLKATQSKNYIDTWLFLSVHFICSVRTTDLARIYHPHLPYAPEIVLEKIANNTFTDNESLLVLLSITERLCRLPLYPNKTSNQEKKSDPIKFEVPSSCQVHLGKLFAIAEAHIQLSGEKTPIIRKINTYQEISRYMGDEIGCLFIENDFRSRSATKSYLQSILMYGDNESEDNSGPKVKGYILAALARSHKGSYGEFAATTATYLKDAKFNGLTPEFVAFELLERGVLSFIPAMLLKILTDGKYDDLNVQNQTKLITSLNMNAYETESIISALNTARTQAVESVKEALHTNTDIITILHRIGSGEAVSKDAESGCLATAVGKLCPFKKNKKCIICKYEISTKSTLFLLFGEYNRLNALYKQVTTQYEKKKYRYLITKVVLPKMNEMLITLKELYGEDAYKQYENLIKENVYEG